MKAFVALFVPFALLSCLAAGGLHLCGLPNHRGLPTTRPDRWTNAVQPEIALDPNVETARRDTVTSQNSLPNPALTERALTEPALSNREPSRVDPQVIRDILTARSRQGDLFAGTLFESLDGVGLEEGPRGELGSDNGSQGEFAEILTRWVASQDRETERQDSGGRPSGGLEMPAVGDRPFDGSPPRLSRRGSTVPRQIGARPTFAKSLRCSARRLEQRAAEYELADRFGDADRLRELAQQLWLEARQAMEQSVQSLQSAETDPFGSRG